LIFLIRSNQISNKVFKIIKLNYISFRFKKHFFINVLKKLHNNKKFKGVKTGNNVICKICKSQKIELIAEVDRVGFQCDTVVCSNCNFTFNKNFISNPSDFYKNHYGGNRWINPKINFNKRISKNAFSWKRYNYLQSYFEKNSIDIKKILEVGCGDGCNLFPFFKSGKTILGYDFGQKFLEPGINLGMDLRYGDISDVDNNSKFDLIMLVHSYEHFIDLDKVLKQIKSLLSEKGLVYVEVPGLLSMNQSIANSQSIMGVPSSNNFINYIQYEHNYHFTLKHLTYIWERNGFYLNKGDEGIRAIFSKKEIENYKKLKIENLKSINIINHLRNVEANFLTLHNLLKIIKRKFKLGPN
jgi:SAM-dependent methyltransferase